MRAWPPVANFGAMVLAMVSTTTAARVRRVVCVMSLDWKTGRLGSWASVLPQVDPIIRTAVRLK